MMTEADVGPIPRLDIEDRVFNQPWQAQVFSLVVALHRAGLFPWKEWVEVFSVVVRRAPALPGESANDAYYRQWVSALEEMVVRLGFVGEDDILERDRDWRLAYLNTPHGQPVHLLNAVCPPDRTHSNSTPGVPATISPARATEHL